MKHTATIRWKSTCFLMPEPNIQFTPVVILITRTRVVVSAVRILYIRFFINDFIGLRISFKRAADSNILVHRCAILCLLFKKWMG